MGGELVHEIPGFVEYRIADIVFGLSEQTAGWTRADDEYPHYAFYLDGENFDVMKRCLDRAGVPNYRYRRDRTALNYFRGPAGNLFEVCCPRLKEAASFARGKKQGGSYDINFAALDDRWNG